MSWRRLPLIALYYAVVILGGLVVVCVSIVGVVTFLFAAAAVGAVAITILAVLSAWSVIANRHDMSFSASDALAKEFSNGNGHELPDWMRPRRRMGIRGRGRGR